MKELLIASGITIAIIVIPCLVARLLYGRWH